MKDYHHVNYCTNFIFFTFNTLKLFHVNFFDKKQ